MDNEKLIELVRQYDVNHIKCSDRKVIEVAGKLKEPDITVSPKYVA